MNKKDFESYKNQVLISIKTNKMALMSDGILLKWLEKTISEFPEEKKDLNNKKSGVNNGK